jgi:transcriptional regulator with XRE-family HTH domain
MLRAAQIRAARALLGWRQEELSKAAGVGAATIHRIERGSGPVLGNVSTVLKIQEAFEQAGVQFIDEDESGGFGLRMAKKKKKR